MPHEAIPTMATEPGPAAGPVRARRWRRWVAILVVSALIHLALIDGLPTGQVDRAHDLDETPLRATIAPIVPPPPVETPAPVPAPAPAPIVKTAPRPARPRPLPAPVDAAAVRAEAPEVASRPPEISPVAPTAPAPSAPAPAAVVTPAAPATRVTPPASARLDYTVVSKNANQSNPIYGKGTITWNVFDGHYATDLQAAASILFFSLAVLASHSDGEIGPTGLAPDRYVEAPRKRATVATNFNRDDRQSITFSASNASVPLVAGAQDRLSVLFQIGALVIGDPAKATPGASVEIPVAGVRGTVESWRFDFVANETLDTGVGSIPTAHLQKAASPGGNDRTIDVWVAQANGGYPARVMYTEPSGNTVTMTLDGIRAVDAQ